MAANFAAVFQLRQDAVSQLFAQLNAPLVKGEDVEDRAPVKILCSYRAISAPRLNGVISRSRMELVGRLPSNTLNGTTCSRVAGSLP